MADTPTLELQIRDNSEKAIQGLKRLASSLNGLKAAIGNGIGLEKVKGDLEKLSKDINKAFGSETIGKITKVANAIKKISNSGQAKLPVTAGVTQMAKAVKDSAPSLDSLSGSAKAVKSETDKLSESTSTVKTSFKEFAEKIKESVKGLFEQSKSIGGLKGSISKLISPLDKLITRFNRLLMTRILRTVIKEIGKAFQEGITNVRAYSKAIDGSFNKAMTGAEDALLKMKNSLGAALAPALEALIPVLHTVVGWFIELVNYVNQFISLLTGKATWTRAIDASAAEFEKTKKSVAGTSKEVKNLLADFDELNIIQQQPSGSGGIGGKVDTVDYTTMFEEVGQFDGKLKEIVGWLKDNMGEVKKIAGLIGSALLGWKFASSFTGPLAQFASLFALGATIALTWNLVTLFDGKYLESKDIGWLVADVLTTALGAFATKSLITSVLGTNYGYVAAGIVLAVSATATMKAIIGDVDTSALSKESVAGLLVAAVKYGAAGVFLAKMFGSLGKHVHHFSGSELVAIGGGVALATFGAAVGIKATVESVKNDETRETLEAKAIGSLSMGAAAGLIGKKLFNLKTIETIKFSAGIALLSFGVFTGIKAFAGAIDSDDSKEKIYDFALSSLSAGIGAGLIGSKLFNLTAGETVLTSAASAFVIFGVFTAIQAVSNSIASKDKYGDILGYAGSSLSLGIGAGLFGRKFFNLTAGETVLTSAASALVVFGVFTAIQAVSNAIASGDRYGDILGYATSSLSLGIGAGLFAKKFFNLTAGETVATSAGAILLTFGVFTAIQAVSNSIASKDKRGDILGYAASSLSLGIGAGLFTKKFFNLTAGETVLTSAASALVIFGVFTAIQAVSNSIASKDKYGDILGYAAASLSLGIGAGLFVKKFFNLTAGETVLTSAGAVLITFGVFTAIQAVSNSIASKDKYGDLVGYAASSLSIGIGAGLFAKKFFNLTTGQTVLTSAASALVVFGVFTAIQAVSGSLASNDRYGDILGYAASSLSLGIGAGLFAKKLFNLTAGETVLTSAGAVALTFGVFTAIQAVSNSIASKDKYGDLVGYAASSLSLGIGTGLFTKKFFNLTAGETVLTSAASALVIFGVFTAIQAVSNSIASNDKYGDLVGYAASSLSLGIGAGLFAKKFFNLTAGQTVLTSAASALVVFGVFTAIQAVSNSIASKDKYDDLLGYAASSLSIGIGVGLFGKKLFNLTAGETVLTGVGNALLIFGAFTGVQAYAEAIDAGITEESIKKTLESSLSMGAGAGLIGSKLFHLDTLQSVQFAAGMAALVLGGYIGVAAFSNAVKGQATEQDVKAALFSSLLLGLAGTDIASGLFKMNIFRAMKLGGGVASLIVGAYVGITALTTAVKNEEITTETIAKEALAALGVGLGSYLIAAALGAPAGIAGIIGGVAGVATVAALVGVTAILTSSKKDLKWGTVRLTDEDIKDFVKKTLFANVPVDAAIEIISAKVTASDEQKLDIQKQVEEIFAEYSKIKAGIDVENSYKNMQKQLFGDGEGTDGGLIGRIQEYAQGQTSLLTTSFSLMPIITDAGEDVSKEYLEAGISGWQGLSTYVTDLGTNISDLLKKAITDGLDDLEQQMLDSLVSQLTNVTRAMTEAQISTGAYADLGIKLGDLDKDSFYKAFDYYIEYRDQLYSSYHQMYKKELESYAGLVSGYTTRAENERKFAELYEKGSTEYNKHIEAAKKYEEIAQGFKTQYEELLASYNETVNAAVEKQAEQGRQLIYDAILGLYDESKLKFSKTISSDAFQFSMVKGDAAGSAAMLKQALWNSVSNMLGVKQDQLIDIGFNINDFVSEKTRQSIIGYLEKIYKPEQVQKFIEEMGWTTPEVDTSGLTDGLEQAEKDVKSSTDGIIDDIKRLDGMQITYAPTISAFGGRGITLTAKFNMMAEGGFVSTGDMFIAREAGPELVGRIGNRTAVANNDQIVSGVANGVAAGQSEQNYLLRQQNEYLRAILAKESTVRVEPSAGWGRFNRQSEQMYARNAGG